MGLSKALQMNFQRPKLSLSCYFVAWKLLLLLVALVSPGPGYDTSTSLALEPVSTGLSHGSLLVEDVSICQWNIILKLTRWDALYFTKIAHSGYVYEQEWMAGFGFTRLLGLLSIFGPSLQPMALVSLVGISVAHAAHLLSVLILYDLGLLSLGTFPESKRSVMALLAACLHIISPAGIFLSAPYAESLFSLMTFLGFYLYGKSLIPLVETHYALQDLFLMLAGLCLGLATTIRANGLLNGLIFVYEAVTSAHGLFIMQGLDRRRGIQRLCVVFCAGAVMGCISFFPQYLAYLEYCVPLSRRPWCSRLIPSIYTWIQSEYWGVGLLNYWTLGNLPLFFLATPMLFILCVSGIWTWTSIAPSLQQHGPNIQDTTHGKSKNGKERIEYNFQRHHDMPRRLALPQLVVALLGLTTYHVQIITRLSSGYPVWYWWLAHVLIEEGRNFVDRRKHVQVGLVVTRWMVMYAIIQGGLYASFLPPA